MEPSEPSDPGAPPEPSADDEARSLLARPATIAVGATVAILLVAVIGWMALRGGDVSGGDASGGRGRQYTPTFATTDCAFTLDTEVEFTCGWLTVPEDRDDPDGVRDVRLHVVVFESTATDAPDDPLVYLEGGPGGKGLETLRFSFVTFFEPLLADRDLIMLDQRGVGLSVPSLDCSEVTDFGRSQLDQDQPPDLLRTGQLAAITQCRDRLIADGVDLSQYNSVENAADIADLRIAMGIDEWNLYGVSYGTRLAATIMRDHPEGIRSVILDSAYPLESNLLTETPRNFDRSLSQLWSGCAASAACESAYPNLQQRFFEVADQLEADPIIAPVRDIFGGASHDFRFDGEVLIGMTFLALYSDVTIQILPQMIEELERGETTTIALLSSIALANAEFVSFGMYLSVQCHEEASFTTLEAIEEGLDPYPLIEAAFRGGSTGGDFMLEACAVWGAGAADPIENQPVVSDISTLVFAGEYDPITPPRWGMAVTDNLSNATFVQIPGGAHGASIAECPRSVIFSFLADPSGTPNVACVAETGGIDFTLPDPAAAAISLVPFSTGAAGAEESGVVPDGWTSPAPGIHERLDWATDLTRIVQRGGPADPTPFMTSLAQDLGIPAPLEPTDRRISEPGEWQLWHGEGGRLALDFAVRDTEGGSAMVFMVSYAAERDQLFEELLIPAIEAFRTSSDQRR